MTIAANTKLGHYEIRSKLGEGGMGEVYLAEAKYCINTNARLNSAVTRFGTKAKVSGAGSDWRTAKGHGG